jgi:hypothetical protein
VRWKTSTKYLLDFPSGAPIPSAWYGKDPVLDLFAKLSTKIARGTGPGGANGKNVFSMRVPNPTIIAQTVDIRFVLSGEG